MSSAPDFADFVSATTPALLRAARAITRDEHDAWDLLQDTYVRLGTRWARVARTENPLAYARTVMVRLNLDRLRRLRRELDRTAGRAPETAPAEPDVDWGWLPAAWETLTPRQRTVVGLHLLEDHGVGQLAALLGCGPASVRTHLSRGLARLRAAAPDELRSTRGRR